MPPLAGFVVCGLIKSVSGLRLSQEEEHDGADFSIHRIGATPDREADWRSAASAGGFPHRLAFFTPCSRF